MHSGRQRARAAATAAATAGRIVRGASDPWATPRGHDRQDPRAARSRRITRAGVRSTRHGAEESGAANAVEPMQARGPASLPCRLWSAGSRPRRRGRPGRPGYGHRVVYGRRAVPARIQCAHPRCVRCRGPPADQSASCAAAAAAAVVRRTPTDMAPAATLRLNNRASWRPRSTARAPARGGSSFRAGRPPRPPASRRSCA